MSIMDDEPNETPYDRSEAFHDAYVDVEDFYIYDDDDLDWED